MISQTNPFVCLDEMNLARVEHYFSDFLSVLESRRKEHGRVITDAVLGEDQIERMKLDSLGPSSVALKRLKAQSRSLGIPPNLFIVGTVNMDETTQPFSRKVLDRANTLEFNEIDLMEGVNGDIPEDEVPALNLSSDFLKGEFASLADIPPDKQEIALQIASFLQEVNRSLVKAGFEVGYRVRDESIAFTIYGLAAGMSMKEAKENIVLQKVLPRLQGSSPRIEKALISLMQQFAGDEDISEPESPGFSERLISLRTHSDASPVLRKIAGMLLIFLEEGFTSYWLA
jgi:5-methylcytosine-specific restriction endonuclease McrBC GTP-binding regulatory subunit McrB